MLPCNHPYAAACPGVINAKGDGPLRTAMQHSGLAGGRMYSASSPAVMTG